MNTWRWNAHRGSGTTVRRRHKRIRNRLAFLLIFLSLLSGCESTHIPPTVRNAEPLSCDIFTQSRWKEFRFGIDSPAEVAATVVDLWRIEQDQIRFSSSFRSDLTLEWSNRQGERNVSYSAWFGEERQLEGIEASWRPFATLSQVIECLGAPDFYSGRYELDHEPQLDFRFWYVDTGFSFRHYSYPRRRTHPPINPTQRIDGFHVAAPLRSRRAAPEIYTAGDDPARFANALCLIKPWPGSIEAIEITWHDNDSRCVTVGRIFW